MKFLVLFYAIIVLLLVLGVFLFFFPLIQICGYSMFPTMLDGEFYLSKRVFRKSECEVGSIYVYKPPYEGREERYVIKRLCDIQYGKNGEVRYYFLGDNYSDSYDSRYYGFVDSENVVAKIILRKEV